MDQRRVCGQENRGQTGAVLAAEPIELVSLGRVQPEAMAPAPEAPRRGARAVGRQLDQREAAGELPLPVGDLELDGGSLRRRGIGRRVRRGPRDRRLTREHEVVQPADLVEEPGHRRLVDDDRVPRDQEDVCARLLTDQRGPEQGTRLEVERLADVGFQDRERLLLARGRRMRPHVDLLELDPGLLLELDRGNAIPGCEHRAERRMANEGESERFSEGVGVQLAGDPHGPEHVVRRTLRGEVVQYPEPLLGGGERPHVRSTSPERAHTTGVSLGASSPLRRAGLGHKFTSSGLSSWHASAHGMLRLKELRHSTTP